jgi:hypothetical protein
MDNQKYISLDKLTAYHGNFTFKIYHLNKQLYCITNGTTVAYNHKYYNTFIHNIFFKIEIYQNDKLISTKCIRKKVLFEYLLFMPESVIEI